MTIWDCRRLNHKVLGTHTGHLFYCESCLKEAIKHFHITEFLTFQIQASSKSHCHDIVRGLVDGRNPPVNALRACSERLRKYSSYVLACLIHL